MVGSIDIHEREREEPVWRGLFYAGDVVRLLSATDGAIRGDHLDLGPRAVQGWSRRGFFEMEKNEYARNRAFISFGGVITARAIALLLSYGIRIGRIQEAHEHLRDVTGMDFPFASRGFWVGADSFSADVYGKLDSLVVTAGRHGAIPFRGLMYGRIGDLGDMEFCESEGEFVTAWEPVPGIVINPGVQTGAACVKGTRTPTYSLYGCYVAGDAIDSLAYWFELGVNEVEVAIAWEERLAHV